MGYLSDPEIGGSADESRDSKNQKVIVGWKWGELPETSLNESQSEPHISANQSESFESNQSERVESPLEESRLNVTYHIGKKLNVKRPQCNRLSSRLNFLYLYRIFL